MAQLQLAPQQIQDFQVIRDLKPDLLGAVVEHLSSLTPLKPADLLSALKEAFDGDGTTAECVMRLCLSLNGLVRQTGMDFDAVIESVRFGIEHELEWEEDEIVKWQSVEPQFRELLCADAFRVVTKAIELSYEYANLYRKGRILTDIRPLFTEEADAIEAAVVSYTLRLRYDDVEGDHELSIAMDEEDVRELSQQCERALKKASTAQDVMKRKVGIPTIVTGERDDG